MKVFYNVAEIKTARQEQRDNPVIYSLLGVIIGELDRLPIPRGQEPTQDQIYAVIKKLYEAAKEMREMTPEADQEYMYLKDFIKQMMTEDELRKVISESGCKNMGEIMKFLKMNYNGTYDGKMANMIAKEFI
jgi:uncharacterized protein YqeY